MADGSAAPRRPVAEILRVAHGGPAGYGFGLSLPFLRAFLRIGDLSDAVAGRANEILTERLPAMPGPDAEAASSLAHLLAYWVPRLEEAVGVTRLEQPLILSRNRQQQTCLLALPGLEAALTHGALKAIVRLYVGLDEGEAAEDAASDIDAFLETSRPKVYGGSNTLLFLEAAHRRRIPWTRIGGNVFRIGHGANARWIDSSFTDRTPVIATNIARNKLLTAQVLRQAGLPVPDHKVARDGEAACRIADQLGYPVVVKPLDRDGGMAVSAGIRDASGVVRAFETARKVTRSVLVEKHVDGRDYRLVVFEGQLIWALERVPGGVTGDGRSTVRQLVDRLNADPARSHRANAPLKPLDFDLEAEEMLQEGGLDGESVLDAGEWVRLRRAANVASGGTPVGVLDKVHPINRQLAERAARALRLDLAGIDLLIPDISRPWTETGAIICEVNAQPTIGNTTAPHLYGAILDRMVRGKGRIPIAVLAGVAPASAVPELVRRVLAATGRKVGMASRDGAVLDGERLEMRPSGVHTAASVLVGDFRTQAMVVTVDEAETVLTGLPFDRAAVVALAGSSLHGNAASGDFVNLCRMLLPMSWGRAVIDGGDPACVGVMEGVQGLRLTVAAPDETLSGVRQHLQRHGATVRPVDDGLRISDKAWRGRDLLVLERGDDADFACSPREAALAAAIGMALGCSEEHIRAGLQGVRLDPAAVPAYAAKETGS
jgi:cyanophycin synthetase